MGDSMDLMRKMWGMAGLPGIPNPANLASMAMRLPQQLPSMVAPTFDVNELDKRIADLRAVEQWLELNASMLRTTIQTLEVQRATIATLKGISGAMLAPLHQARPESGSQQRGDAAPSPMPPPEQRRRIRSAAREEEQSQAPQGEARPRADGHRGSAEPDRVVEHAAGSVHQDRSEAAAGAAAGAAQAPAKKPSKTTRRARKAGKAG